jgi:photosystem II stability/assembly factor-like uncharacterized protein
MCSKLSSSHFSETLMAKRLLLFFGMLFCSNTAFAQWQIAAPGIFPGLTSQNYMQGAITFKDGLTWAAFEKIWVSPDSGQTWHETNFPRQQFIYIVALQFFDRFNGIALQNNDLWATHDGGQTWQNILSRKSTFINVGFGTTPNEIIVSSSGSMYATQDGGLTWTRTVAGQWPVALLANASSGGTSALTISDLKTNYVTLSESTDKGNTWQALAGSYQWDSFSLGIDSCDRNTIYSINEDIIGHTDIQAQVYVSHDRGKNFQVASTFPVPFFTGDLAISPNAIFASTESSGIYRSIDQGVNWSAIGGPSGLLDSRFLAVINDNILIAIDGAGNIWRTTTSGNLPLPHDVWIQDVTVDTIGVDARVPIYCSTGSVGNGATFAINYDTTEFIYAGTKNRSDVSVDAFGTAPKGHADVSFSAFDLSQSDSIIGFLTLKFKPGSDYCGLIGIDSVNVGGKITECLGTNHALTTKICLAPGCDTKTLAGKIFLGKMPSFSLTPDPARDHIQLYTSVQIENAEISVVDALGTNRLFMKTTLYSSSPCTINISTLAAGTYFVKVEAFGLTATRRFIKTK